MRQAGRFCLVRRGLQCWDEVWLGAPIAEAEPAVRDRWICYTASANGDAFEWTGIHMSDATAFRVVALPAPGVDRTAPAGVPEAPRTDHDLQAWHP